MPENRLWRLFHGVDEQCRSMDSRSVCTLNSDGLLTRMRYA